MPGLSTGLWPKHTQNGKKGGKCENLIFSWYAMYAAFRTGDTRHGILDHSSPAQCRPFLLTPAKGNPLKGCLMNVASFCSWNPYVDMSDDRLAIKCEMLKIICITYAPRLTAYLMQLR